MHSFYFSMLSCNDATMPSCSGGLRVFPLWGTEGIPVSRNFSTNKNLLIHSFINQTHSL